MSNLKHTPAPWYQYGNLIVDANRHSVCELLPMFDLDDATKEGIEYNAKLIASAPELLEALMEIIKSCNPKDVTANKVFMGTQLGEHYVGSCGIPSDKAIHLAVNAIKKATEL